LLANLLRWQLGEHYHLEEEVPVGIKPLQIDILLLRRGSGELGPSACRVLAGLAERLNEFTLVEFKSPTDTLRAGDFQVFLAYSLLYRSQNEPLLDPGRLNLVVLAPKLTRPYRQELRVLGVNAVVEEKGIWRLEGGLVPHRSWVLETDELVGLEHPLLTVVSPTFLSRGVETYEMMQRGGYNELVVYIAQQIQQFRLQGSEFAMQHAGAETDLVKVMRDIWNTMTPQEREDIFGVTPEQARGRVPREELLQQVTVEEWLQHVPVEELLQRVPAEDRVKGLPAEDRVKGLPAEDRLKGLTVDDILKALPPEEVERFRQLPQGQPKADEPTPPKE
jgi:hypothetical protein